jgi:hypothetical protein
MIEQIKTVQNNSVLAARLQEYAQTVRNYAAYYRKKIAFYEREGNLCAGVMLQMKATGQQKVVMANRELTYQQLDFILGGIIKDIEKTKATYAAGVSKITAMYPDLVELVQS